MYISYNILLCLPCRELDLDYTAGLVGFDSDWLASSTTANDYFDFARTLGNDYSVKLQLASLTTSTIQYDSCSRCRHTDRLTTISRIRLRLVGFINNRQRLLDFVKNARRHIGDYFDYLTS
jgi:hypothetical protein